MKGKAEERAKQSKGKKIFQIIVDILFCCFFIICILALFLSISAKKSADGAMRLFGYEMRIVISPSMEKCELTDVSQFEIKDLPVKTMVFIETVPEDEAEAEKWYAALKVGAVLTFRYIEIGQKTITHRIVDITEKESGGYIFVLEGDNKNSKEGNLQQTIDTTQKDSPNYVIGKVTGKSYVLGLLITALKSTWGIVFIVIIPSLIIIILEIIRIIDVFSEKKKREKETEETRKDDEIAELKRQLAEANGQNLEKESKADERSD